MFLVFGHLLTIAICLLMKVFGVEDMIIGVIFVILSSLIVMIYVINLKCLGTWAKTVILMGFITRLVLVIVDVFIARLPDTGGDDDGFYRESLSIVNSDYEYFSQSIHGFFPRFLSIIYYFIGSSRLSAQYLNVLFYAISAILFAKALINFKVSERTMKLSMLLFCFAPNSVLYNSILRRETIMELFVCSSIYNFSKWYVSQKNFFAMMTVLFLVVAAVFHTGFILGAPVLIIYFTLYDKDKHAVSFSVSKTSKMIVLLICSIIIGMSFLSLWQNKFSAISELDDVYYAASRARGGSVYLQGYSITNFGQLLLFAPLKVFYFLFSPVPWMFRNVMDIISFFLDAMIYVVLIYKTMRMPKESSSKAMLVTFLVLCLVFALGTSNGGTAIRHRFSMLPFLLASYSIAAKGALRSYDRRKRNNRYIQPKLEQSINKGVK